MRQSCAMFFWNKGTHMKKLNIDSAELLFWAMVGLIVMAVGFGVEEIVEQNIYSNKHDNFRPMPELSQNEEAAVYNIGDSLLTERKARFDALVQDYNRTFEDVNIKYRGIMPVHQKFNKIYVSPKYANQIGVQNIKQYSKYLDRYERDSLQPVYKNVYYRRVLPLVHNGHTSK